MNGDKKIFVVGNSRSGTTMMGRILGKNGTVFTFHELHFFEQLWTPTKQPLTLPVAEATLLLARLLTIQRDGYFNQKPLTPYLPEAKSILINVDQPVTAFSIFSAFLSHETKKNNKLIPCDQTPRNVYYLSEILSIDPHAYVINMIRDPRDVLLSQKNKWKRSLLGAKNIPKKQLLRFWVNYHPITMSLLWKSGINAANQLGEHSRVIHIKFESLLQNPKETIQTICNFLNLAYDPAMLAVPQIGSSHQADQQEIVGVDKGAVARWRQSSDAKNDLYICEKLTHPFLESFQYPTNHFQPNLISLAWLVITWPVKLGIAFLLNLGRTQNLVNTLKKRLGSSPRIKSIHKTT